MIRKANDREKILNELLELWNKSVCATHHFMSEKEISEIGLYVPGAIMHVVYLIIAEDVHHQIDGFMGIQGRKIEMLFLLPEERRKGMTAYVISFAKSDILPIFLV